MENKPKVLYRGLKVNYDNLQNFRFSGVDLYVNYEPIIDKYGRKTVSDGNEYGVYMTDNLSMVMSAYGDLHNDGIQICNDLKINNRALIVPSVGIIYQINTDGLEIRKPFITEYLRAHYNNGFQGNEWITDYVPSSNYTLYRVRIGNDFLHDAEDIDLSRVDDISEFARHKIEVRKKRLEAFATDMRKIPYSKRINFGKTEQAILREIYGENGLKYINEDCIITDNIDGMLRYLIAKTFKQNEDNIDFQTIVYINSLKDRSSDIESLINVLKMDKMKVLEERKLFKIKKEKEESPYSTTRFDIQEARIDKLISLILSRKEKDTEMNSFFENVDIESEHYEKIK